MPFVMSDRYDLDPYIVRYPIYDLIRKAVKIDAPEVSGDHSV